MEAPTSTDCDEWVMVRRPPENDLWTPSLIGGEINQSDLKVSFGGPAERWTDAVPIGAGRVGAMVWGGVVSETINLNEDTLWTGIPGNYTNPSIPKALYEVRELIDNGQFAEASTKSVDMLGNLTESFQPLGDIKLEFDSSHSGYNKQTYQRELDLDTVTVKVNYSVGEIEFTREHFASYPDQVIVTKISGNQSGSISFTASLTSQLNYRTYIYAKNQILLEGECPGITPPNKKNDNPKGIRFSAILDIQISDNIGDIRISEDGKLKVEGSNWAVIRLVASSSFGGPFVKPLDSKKDPTLEATKKLKLIGNLTYDELYARHLDDFQNLFHRVELKLLKSSKSELEKGNVVSSAQISTADRVKSFQSDEDPSLVELLFQFGRYLLISCSRPGTQAANLQGIWNYDLIPKWQCAPHLNINLQMNYWPSLPCNLQECQEPLFDYMANLSRNGTKTARINYEASGWVAHNASDIWAKTDTLKGKVKYAIWPMGGAWVCTHLWEHYTYTLDKDFLEKNAYPLLEGCTSFLLDWLIEGRGGYLETNPSTSPEHAFIAPDGKPASLSYSTTMDMSIIKEVFSIVISAAEVLGKSKDDLVERVRKALPRLYPTQIARDGSIMEWAQYFEDPEVRHRHLSHLFGLFPGHTITFETTPSLCKAAAYSIYKRGEDGPGWSTAWKIALWARLYDSENAYKMVKHLFVLIDPDHEARFEGGLYSNLFTAHPPFQIDANFGFCAAIAEMLVQSTMEDLYLLPALPRDKWPNGSVRGLKARGGVTISISWSEGDLHEIGIWCKNSNIIRKLRYRGINAKVKISAGKVYTYGKTLKCVRVRSVLESSACI